MCIIECVNRWEGGDACVNRWEGGDEGSPAPAEHAALLPSPSPLLLLLSWAYL
jgi:hypothetical protein